MQDLHLLPKFRDSLSYLYIEHALIEREAGGLIVFQETGKTLIPVASLSLLMLGPGTNITHAAIKLLTDNGCGILWTAQDMNNLYAVGFGETRSTRHILRQAECLYNPELKQQVILKMYEQRFGHTISPYLSIEQIRGLEGARMRTLYQHLSQKYNVLWEGREYNRNNWQAADPINRAISCANALLYGICHVAIVSAGYSPALGFIHTGYYLAFVHDIADLYKHETSLPIAFETVAESTQVLEPRVRSALREKIREERLLKRIIPEIDELLQVSRDETSIVERGDVLPQPWWSQFAEAQDVDITEE